MPAAGSLDRRISIERATATTNALNETILTWECLTEVWAAVEEVPDGERWRAAEVAADVTTRFTIRWSGVVADVNPKDRIVYKDRIHDVKRVKELGRREGIEITASARADLIPETEVAA